jgi:hypothetical protein
MLQFDGSPSARFSLWLSKTPRHPCLAKGKMPHPTPQPIDDLRRDRCPTPLPLAGGASCPRVAATAAGRGPSHSTPHENALGFSSVQHQARGQVARARGGQETQEASRVPTRLSCLMGEEGFEPPQLKATGLQPAPTLQLWRSPMWVGFTTRPKRRTHYTVPRASSSTFLRPVRLLAGQPREQSPHEVRAQHVLVAHLVGSVGGGTI